MDITKLKILYPVVADMADAKEVFWLNERYIKGCTPR